MMETLGGFMEVNQDPNPTPRPDAPTNPGLPPEIDTGGLHTRPEVDYGHEPSQPMQPEPMPPEREPIPEREEPHEPDVEPGREGP